jgi:nondiscriminating glutamyl-tRNA synthetase
MKISHVIRGQEHLSNTPYQLMVYCAFGWNPPQFAHIPLILGKNGKKLSKRDESIVQFIEQYRDLGYMPEAIINYLALLGWSPGEKSTQEIFSLQELTGLFSFERVHKSGAVFDPPKLNATNKKYQALLSDEELIARSTKNLVEKGLLDEEFDRAWAEKLVLHYKKDLHYPGEIISLSSIFFTDELKFPLEAVEVLLDPSVAKVIPYFYGTKLKNLANWEATEIKNALKETQQETGIKGKGLYMPIRVAVSGEIHGPDLEKTIELLGREKVYQRMEAIIAMFNRRSE